MNPSEKIDSILNFLKNRSDLSASFSKEYIWDLYVSKTPELKINSQFYNEIFIKLIEDGYIRENKNDDSPSTYHLTIKGHEFSGYVEEEQLISQSKHNEEILQTQTLLSSQGTTKWTKWLTLLTLGLFVVAVIVLLKDCSFFSK